MMSLANTLLKDPPPTHAFELSEAGIAFAPYRGSPAARIRAFRARRLLVSPVHDNIQQPHVLLEHIRALAARQRPQAPRRADSAGLLRARRRARFRHFPVDADEQLALVRFRLKKSVPFDVDSAVVSYRASSRAKSGAKIEVLAAVIAVGNRAQYEAPFRAAGFQPGLVTTSSLAALNLLDAGGITMLVKLSGRILSVLVLQDNAVKLARCVEMDDAGVPDN